MKDYENILKALECCSAEGNAHCDDCPYTDNNCRQKDRDARELILELKAQLEQPKITVDYESIALKHSEELRMALAECDRVRTDLHRAETELIHLRAIKATAEAFLGRKIDGQM